MQVSISNKEELTVRGAVSQEETTGGWARIDGRHKYWKLLVAVHAEKHQVHQVGVAALLRLLQRALLLAQPQQQRHLSPEHPALSIMKAKGEGI